MQGDSEFRFDGLEGDFFRLFGDSNVGNLITPLLQVIPSVLRHGTSGKAKAFGSGVSSPINMIPSDGSSGGCTPVLVAFCFDNDSFDARMREVAYHAGILCPDTEAVVLVTSKWDSKLWKRNHAGAFGSLKAKVLVYLAEFGKLTLVSE